MATDPQTFRAHLEYLHEQGWRSLSLLDLESYLATNEEVPARHFLLCLDNTYSSLASNALPVMKEFGFCGVAFIAVQKIGFKNHEAGRHLDEGGEYLDWRQIRDIQYEGVLEFQPYAHGYQTFSERDASEIAEALLASVDVLSRELELPHHYFNHLAWPVESPPERLHNIAADVGFDFQYTAMHASYRPQSTLIQIPRLCFDGCPPEAFKRQFSFQTGPLSGPWHKAHELVISAKRTCRRVLPLKGKAAYRRANDEEESAFPSVLR